MGDEVLRDEVLVAAALRVHEERVAAVHRDHQELGHRPARAELGEDGGEPAPLPEAGPLEEAVERVDDRVLPAAAASYEGGRSTT